MKERLRMLLAERDPDRVRHRLWQFYDAAARADMDETTRLATTIETWWPAVLVALTEDVTLADPDTSPIADTPGHHRLCARAVPGM